jgi:glycosyltransferase involved in cell wall biosynthesis
LARRLSAARRLWRRAAPPRTASEAAAPASTRAAAPPALRPAAAARLPVLLLVSRLRWEKGLDGFARVVRSLEKARVPHLAVVVGAGSAREALRRRLPRAVFTGALAGAELARAYASADVFLTASTTEGWGGTALEALASGLPVAAFDASGISQLVEPGRSGLLAPADDVPALARHAATLLSLPADERARYRAAARARAADFAWEVELRRMEGYYAHATATAPRRR